jgi:hypothetical protein
LWRWSELICRKLPISFITICLAYSKHSIQVAQACNPSYSGGRDQEDHGSKLAKANSSWDPISKKPITKKGWLSDSRCRPWVQVPVLQNKNKNKKQQSSYAGSTAQAVGHLP